MTNVKSGPWKRGHVDTSSEAGGGGVDNGGGPPDDPHMDERVKKLEELAEQARAELHAIDTRLTKMDTRLDHMPGKSDLSDAMNAQIKWIVGTAVVLGGMALTIMTFVLNNAVPKTPTPPAVQPTPIIITVPAPAASPASEPPVAPDPSK